MASCWCGGAFVRLSAAAAAIALALAAPAPAGAQATGRIEGTATIAPQLTRERPRVRIYSEPGTAPPASVEESPFSSVVLYLESVPRQAGPRTPAQVASNDEQHRLVA